LSGRRAQACSAIYSGETDRTAVSRSIRMIWRKIRAHLLFMLAHIATTGPLPQVSL
jgi:hypothetical protein